MAVVFDRQVAERTTSNINKLQNDHDFLLLF